MSGPGDPGRRHGGDETTPAAGPSAGSEPASTPGRAAPSTPPGVHLLPGEVVEADGAITRRFVPPARSWRRWLRSKLARQCIWWGARLWHPNMPLGSGRIGQRLIQIGLILAGREEFRR